MDVKTLCLGVLNGGDATGYEIRKQCDEGPFSHFYAAGFGSIYPALNMLAEEGCVELADHQPTARPGKKIYRITPRGKLALLDALSQEPKPDRFHSESLFQMFFGHLLSARRLDGLLGSRMERLSRDAEVMAGIDEAALPAGERFVLSYGKSMVKAELEFLETNQHILLSAALVPDAKAAE